MGYTDNVWPPKDEDETPTRDNPFPAVGPHVKRVQPAPPVSAVTRKHDLTPAEMRVGKILAGILVTIVVALIFLLIVLAFKGALS